MPDRKDIFPGDGDYKKESSKNNVERGQTFIQQKLAEAGKSVFHFLKFNEPPHKDMLVVSSALAMVGAAYLFIRQEAPGPAVAPLWENIQNFINHELPQIFSSVQNADIPTWDLTKNMGLADITMAAITLLFSLESIKEATRLIVNKMKQKEPA